MIRLKCNNCGAALEIDDAFAGSACRCKHCGTIQTVPAPAAAGKRPATPTSGTSRTLYREARRTSGDAGLDQLAEVVSSSSGLRHARKARDSTAAGGATSVLGIPTGKDRRTMVLILAGALAGIAVGAVAVVMLSRSSPAPAVPAHAAPIVAASDDGAGPAAGKASFCGLPLDESPVVYVIDRGQSSQDSLGYMIAATLASAQSLGRDRKFQVTVWDNGQPPIVSPRSPGFATPDIIRAAERALGEAQPFGSSNAAPAVQQAVASNPASIVLITAKGWDLDDTFVESVLRARGSSSCKIHTISVGESDSGEALQKLATRTGGSFKSVSVADLKQFAAPN